ncbi:MAG: hypothetical protein FWF52_00635 [Candidatus Azobacteroides sp.]|nr:hypothetical protein [Candidatus Azobacteroides sp.]
MIGLYSCGGGSTSSSSALPTSKVDYQMLSDSVALRKVYDAVREKLGENIQGVDRISINIARPSKDETIIRQGKPDEFRINLSYLYPKDKNKLFSQYYVNDRGWSSGEVKGIQLIVGNAETFRLEDEMCDLSPLTAETLFKITQNALAKYQDTAKYSYQYVKNIEIKQGLVTVTVYGKLAANDIGKSLYYKADLQGAAKN